MDEGNDVCSYCGIDAEEPEVQQQSKPSKAKSRIKRIIYFVAFGIFSVFFIVSAIYLGDYFLETVENKNTQNELIDMIEQVKQQQAQLPPYRDWFFSFPGWNSCQYGNIYCASPSPSAAPGSSRRH